MLHDQTDLENKRKWRHRLLPRKCHWQLVLSASRGLQGSEEAGTASGKDFSLISSHVPLKGKARRTEESVIALFSITSNSLESLKIQGRKRI